MLSSRALFGLAVVLPLMGCTNLFKKSAPSPSERSVPNFLVEDASIVKRAANVESAASSRFARFSKVPQSVQTLRRGSSLGVEYEPEQRLLAAEGAISQVQHGLNRVLELQPNYLTSFQNRFSDSLGVAVVDSGIDATWEGSELNLDRVNSFSVIDSASPVSDEQGHGTHVAGIIAARANSTGITGIAPGVRVVSARVLDKNGRGLLSDLLNALTRLCQPANRSVFQVINLSIVTGKSRFLNDLVEECTSQGFVVVSAAGNFSLSAALFSPASAPSSITVGSFSDLDGKGGGLSGSTDDDVFSNFSNYGPSVSLVAPGFQILSLGKAGKTEIRSGTSMAAPFVAGLALGVVAKYPAATPVEVRNTLYSDFVKKLNGPQNGLYATAVVSTQFPPSLVTAKVPTIRLTAASEVATESCTPVTVDFEPDSYTPPFQTRVEVRASASNGQNNVSLFPDLDSCDKGINSSAVWSGLLKDSEPLKLYFLGQEKANYVINATGGEGVRAASVAIIGNPLGVIGQPDGDTIMQAQAFDTISLANVKEVGGKYLLIDSLNNRILIWNTKPEKNTPPSVILGQPSFSESRPNGRVNNVRQMLSGPSSFVYQGGGLWVADAGNRRVVGWKSIPTKSNQEADVVIIFDSANHSPLRSLHGLWNPSWIAGDGTRLFVSDKENNRIYVWNQNPVRDYAAPDLVLGQPDLLTFNIATCDGATLKSPTKVVWAADRLWVIDQGNARVLMMSSFINRNGQPFDVAIGQPTKDRCSVRPSTAWDVLGGTVVDLQISGEMVYVLDYSLQRALRWNQIPSEDGVFADIELIQSDKKRGYIGGITSFANIPGAALAVVVGHSEFKRGAFVWKNHPTKSGQPHDEFVGLKEGALDVSKALLDYPTGITFHSGSLFVADYGFRRVIGWNSLPSGGLTSPSVILGYGPTREPIVNITPVLPPDGFASPWAVFNDGKRLFVGDCVRRRVAVWKSIPKVDGQPPDFVLGQSDLGKMDIQTPNQNSVQCPVGIYSDGEKLVVSDSYHRRVLIWNKMPSVNNAPADVVLGQPDFFTSQVNSGGVSASSLSKPWGIHGFKGGLAVADRDNHRVLVWSKIPSASFQPADFVIGQANFWENSYASYRNRLKQPVSVWLSAEGLFVADQGNSRVVFVKGPITSTSWILGASKVFGQHSVDALGGGDTSGGLVPLSQRLLIPEAIAFDGKRLFVTDSYYKRIVVFSFATGGAQ